MAQIMVASRKGWRTQALMRPAGTCETAQKIMANSISVSVTCFIQTGGSYVSAASGRAIA